MDELESWELTDFNIDGHIALSQKFGQLKMMRSDDGLLILAEYAKYGRIDQEKDTPTGFFDSESTLGFVLDIGIQKKKRLTVGHGFYFGTKMIPTQSTRKVSQSDFNQELFEKIGTSIDSNFQSGDKQKEIEAMRVQYLINEYNNARLLYPNFYADSYLSLMRIIDALSDDARGGYDFAIFASKISPEFNKEIYEKLKATETYKERLDKAIALFDSCLANAKKERWACEKEMSSFGEAEKVVFSCFFSAYQYRSKFVHKGIPFPRVVQDGYGIEEDSVTAYISPALGMSFARFNRPKTGWQEGDEIDIHEIIGDEAPKFKDIYFYLIPTWYFLKKLAKKAILNKIETL